MNNKKEKDILEILNKVEQLDKGIYSVSDFNMDQRSLEKAMSYISAEGFLLHYNSQWADDMLYMFSTTGVSSNGYKFINDSKLTTKAYNVVKSITDLMP